MLVAYTLLLYFFNVSAKSPTSPIGKIFHANSIRLLVRLLLIQYRARNTFSRNFSPNLIFFSREFSEKITLFQGTFGHHWLLTNKLFTVANAIHGRWSRVLCNASVHYRKAHKQPTRLPVYYWFIYHYPVIQLRHTSQRIRRYPSFDTMDISKRFVRSASGTAFGKNDEDNGREHKDDAQGKTEG